MAKLAENEISELQELIQSWIEWVLTRKYYAKQLPLNILAALQTERSPSRGEPEAYNDALCCAFNMVISLADDSERLPFLYVYIRSYRPKPIKTLAYDLGIDSDTVYQRAHNAGAKYLYQAKKLRELNCQMNKEIAGYTD